ncbi:MAG: hypothetical protein OEZ38_10360 [Gammaproteobacteria bacterium]|nr:hypothetical protein [Gammaproteobacteria bacterium]
MKKLIVIVIAVGLSFVCYAEQVVYNDTGDKLYCQMMVHGNAWSVIKPVLIFTSRNLYPKYKKETEKLLYGLILQ